MPISLTDLMNENRDVELEDKPVTPNGIESVRKIVEEKQYAEFIWEGEKKPLVVDMTTANLLVKVYDQMSPKPQTAIDASIIHSRAKFCKFVDLAWSCVK